jgi:hypothetical protein
VSTRSGGRAARLAHGDTVEVAGYRRYADLLPAVGRARVVGR